MSKRLQVILDDREFTEIHDTAARLGLTASEWVRQTLRQARRGQSGDPTRKLAAVRAATRHSFPSGDIGEMLHEIEQGYTQ